MIAPDEHVDRFGAADERIDERVRDVAEHRAHDPFEQVCREFVGECQLDLAGVGREREEAPLAVQVPKRAVAQRDHAIAVRGRPQIVGH